jgi:hypothetical protein
MGLGSWSAQDTEVLTGVVAQYQPHSAEILSRWYHLSEGRLFGKQSQELFLKFMLKFIDARCGKAQRLIYNAPTAVDLWVSNYAFSESLDI